MQKKRLASRTMAAVDYGRINSLKHPEQAEIRTGTALFSLICLFYSLLLNSLVKWFRVTFGRWLVAVFPSFSFAFFCCSSLKGCEFN